MVIMTSALNGTLCHLSTPSLSSVLFPAKPKNFFNVSKNMDVGWHLFPTNSSQGECMVYFQFTFFKFPPKPMSAGPPQCVGVSNFNFSGSCLQTSFFVSSSASLLCPYGSAG
jgi:hypothetical protein